MKLFLKKVFRFKIWYEFYFIISKYYFFFVFIYNEFLNLYLKL